jgi:hypothetical protein
MCRKMSSFSFQVLGVAGFYVENVHQDITKNFCHFCLFLQAISAKMLKQKFSFRLSPTPITFHMWRCL